MTIDLVSALIGGAIAAVLIYGVSALVIGWLMHAAKPMPDWMEEAAREQERRKSQLRLCGRRGEKVR